MFLKLAGASGSEARIAAIGWRGDQLRLWQTEGGTHAFVWRFAFDRDEDARQCEAVLQRKAKGRLVRRGPSIDWAVAHHDTTLGALAKALAAEAVPPAASEQEAKATAALEEALARKNSGVESGVWSVPAFGVQMPAPAGFEAREVHGTQVLFAPLVDGRAFRDNIVVTSSTPPTAATLESELAAAQKTLGVEPYWLVRTERRRISGQEARWLEYTSVQAIGLLHHLEVQWLRSEGGKASVTATALDSRWKDIGTVFAEVLEHLQFDAREAR